MRSLVPGLLLIAVCACSGDDSHRRSTQPKTTPIVKADAGVPAGPGVLQEAMAVAYWTTPDEQAGVAAFTAKDWKTAKASFAAARAAVKDANDPKAPRLELMQGLTDAELEDHPSAATHLAIAYKALPDLSDY